MAGPCTGKDLLVGISTLQIHSFYKNLLREGFPGGSNGKESACWILEQNAGDVGSIPEWGRFPGGSMATQSSILVWRIPGTEEAGGLQFIAFKVFYTTEGV